ncbi:MAG: hypothetical protein Q8O90_09885 [Elusimicrobiota bacterium]|nr:hypothetical protein [Elusimicrobiota bacterium]
MSGSKDLKDLLDKLKGEVGSLPKFETPQAEQPQRAPQPGAGRQERFSRPERVQEQRLPSPGGQNPAWSENKESILFGMLATLTAALGGILAGLDYLVIIGTVFFSCFSLVMALALFGVCLNFRRGGGETAGLADRIDALSRKVEMLSSRAASGGGSSHAAGSPDRAREVELEHKVEELRVLVKSLTKAVGLE